MKARLLAYAALAACSSPRVDDAPAPVATTPSASERMLESGPLPPSSIAGEEIRAGAVDMRVVRKIADQGRWRIACTFDLDRTAHLCATDSLDEEWTAGKVGTRVLVIAKDFSVTEHLISDQIFSSYLWGDFDSDGRPDRSRFAMRRSAGSPKSNRPLFCSSAAMILRAIAPAIPFHSPTRRRRGLSSTSMPMAARMRSSSEAA